MFDKLRKWFRVKEEGSKIEKMHQPDVQNLGVKTECSKFGGAFGSPRGGRSSRRFRRGSLR